MKTILFDEVVGGQAVAAVANKMGPDASHIRFLRLPTVITGMHFILAEVN
jgi:hypothetical protein